jgi:hypothetical protein
MKKRVTVDGKLYPSMNDAAVAFGVNLTTVNFRLRHGWSIEEAFGAKQHPRSREYLKKVMINGKHYPSMGDAAAAFGLKLNTVSSRLRDGWTIEEAFGAKERPPSKFNGEQIVVRGQVFKSRAEACKAFNLSPKIVHFRLKKGWTIDQAFGFEEVAYKGKPKQISIGGRQFRSLAEACRFFGVDKYVLNARVNRYGWTVEQALGVDPRPGYEAGVAGVVYLIEHAADERKYVGVTMGTAEERWDQHVQKAMEGKLLHRSGLHYAIKLYGAESFSVSVIAKAKNHGELQSLEIEYVEKFSTLAPKGFNLNAGGSGTRTKGQPIIVRGHRYRSYQEACRAFQIPWEVARGRIDAGWTPEQVFGLEEREGKFQPQPIEIEGKRFVSLNQAAIAYGIDSKLFAARLKKGWPVSQAIGIEPPDPFIGQPKAVEIEGKRFGSLTQAATAYGIDPKVFSQRLRSGWSVNQALGIEARGNQFTVGGKTFASMSEAARHHGVGIPTFFSRRRQGWTLEQALGLVQLSSPRSLGDVGGGMERK